MQQHAPFWLCPLATSYDVKKISNRKTAALSPFSWTPSTTCFPTISLISTLLTFAFITQIFFYIQNFSNTDLILPQTSSHQSHLSSPFCSVGHILILIHTHSIVDPSWPCPAIDTPWQIIVAVYLPSFIISFCLHHSSVYGLPLLTFISTIFPHYILSGVFPQYLVSLGSKVL